jgi:hypothetical protein
MLATPMDVHHQVRTGAGGRIRTLMNHRMLRLAQHWPTYVLAVVIAASVALLAVAVRSDKTPMFATAAWHNPNGLMETSKGRSGSFVSDRVLQKDEAIFINVTPKNPPPGFESIAGKIESPSFTPARYMVVPLHGLVNRINRHAWRLFDPNGAGVVLECLATGKTQQLLTTPSNDLFERAVFVPRGSCPDKVKLSLQVSAKDTHDGIGTPLAVSAAYALVAGPLRFVVAFGVASLFFLCLFVPPLLVTRLSYLVRGGLALITVGLCGYLSFVMQAVNLEPALILAVTAMLLAAPLLAFAWAAATGRAAGAGALLARLSLAWLIIGATIVLPMQVIPVNGGGWDFNSAFYPVEWSNDNQLPTTMARYVIETDQVQPPGMGRWSITDRGFAPAGLSALVLFGLDQVGLGRESPITVHMAQMIISLANASIVLLVLLLPGLSGGRLGTVAAVAAIFAATPFFFFNLVYSWPKLAAGALQLWGILVLAAALRQQRHDWLWLVPPLILFGFLFHSAVLFMVPVIGIYAVAVVALQVRRGVLVVLPVDLATLCASLIATAILWRYHDSFGEKTSFGATYVLTGDGQFGLSGREVIDAVLAYYGNQTLASVAELRWSNFLKLFWPSQAIGPAHYQLGLLPVLRLAQLWSVVPAMLIAAPCLLLLPGLRRPRSESPEAQDLVVALVLGGATLAALLVVAAMRPVVAVLPYTLLLAPLALAALVADYGKRAVRGLIALHVALFGLIWVAGSWWIWTFGPLGP